MLLVGFARWWYGAGWRDQVSRVAGSLRRVSNWFSISLLLKTLFAPFRQISAGERGNNLASSLRAWGNRLLSRIIGGVVRLFMIFAGGVVLLLLLILSLFRLAFWAIVPLMPVAGAMLMIYVGTPWKLV